VILGDARPIGLFDSGVGGLTVVREVMKVMPGERIIYFGDTARVPYGTKSSRVVQGFALQDARLLMQYDVKLIVVACHTASAVARDLLGKTLPLPVLGVIEPGVRAALRATRNGRIGVIGTRGTISSGTYRRLIAAADPEIRAYGRPCPLFVPLAEEGWVDGSVTREVARTYLAPLVRRKVDTLILGCTHYPLLKEIIRSVMGPDIRLIDSAEETAGAILRTLRDRGIENLSGSRPEHRFMVSDIPHQFRRVGERFLGCRLESLSRIDLDSVVP